MDNYEIKILKRNGNWEKSNKKIELLNSKKMIDKQNINTEITNTPNEDLDFLKSIHQVNLIIDKLEILENDKNNLITDLLQYEKIFISKKNIAEQKQSQISKEIEMFDKTIDVIKNLKKF